MKYLSFIVIPIAFLLSMTTPVGLAIFSVAVFPFILGVIMLFVEKIPNVFKSWNKHGFKDDLYDLIKFATALVIAGLVLLVGWIIMSHYPQQV